MTRPHSEFDLGVRQRRQMEACAKVAKGMVTKNEKAMCATFRSEDADRRAKGSLFAKAIEKAPTAVELAAPFGHDSFLLEVPELDRVIAGFLDQ